MKEDSAMKISFKAKDIFSIPNILSYFRILLIPVIIWAYLKKESGLITAIAVILSGASDVLDGKIARRFNMITDIGKVLDPVADKLTQIAMMFCLLEKYELMLPAFIILVIKEIFMAVTALIEANASQQINGALWYGKVCTVILYATMLILLFFIEIPIAIANTLIIISIIAMLASMILYGIYRFKIILKK